MLADRNSDTVGPARFKVEDLSELGKKERDVPEFKTVVSDPLEKPRVLLLCSSGGFVLPLLFNSFSRQESLLLAVLSVSLFSCSFSFSSANGINTISNKDIVVHRNRLIMDEGTTEETSLTTPIPSNDIMVPTMAPSSE